MEVSRHSSAPGHSETPGCSGKEEPCTLVLDSLGASIVTNIILR